ncbi:MAG: hypothetical protein SFT94_07360 [Pseudanabaenaceae cyanobacterium bins.68]|nr:hypothetical protein [Pseudanabaenaceae cyanobacterium bins.68]
MAIIQTVRCPNCGSLAERTYHAVLAQVQTECHSCDYLMVVSTLNGQVIEAHSPGISLESIQKYMTSSPTLTKLGKRSPSLAVMAD